MDLIIAGHVTLRRLCVSLDFKPHRTQSTFLLIMPQLIFGLAIFVASLVVSAILVRWRPVKLLAKIQLILTIFVITIIVISILVDVLGAWQVAAANAVRRLWTPKADQVLFVCLCLPWLLFTIIHAILAIVVVVGRKLRARNDV